MGALTLVGSAEHSTLSQLGKETLNFAIATFCSHKPRNAIARFGCQTLQGLATCDFLVRMQKFEKF